MRNALTGQMESVQLVRAALFRKLFVSFIAFAIGALFTLQSFAQPAVEAWVQRYNGPNNRSDQPVAIAVDGDGNVIVTGSSNGGSTGNDYATIKYSSAGVPLWTNRFTGPGNFEDKPTAMSVDGNGGVFVTGWMGTQVGSSYATIKYSGAGVPLWTNHYNTPWGWADWATALAVDQSGNVVVTGRGGGQNFHLNFRYDYATIKYSNAGMPLWTNYYNGSVNGQDYASAAGVDGSGNVFVTGSSAKSNFPALYECVTIKYASTGEPVWTNRILSGDWDKRLAVGGNGNVFVIGGAYSTIGYSSAGLPLWTNRYSVDNKGALATALTVDGEGNVLVTGYSDTISNLTDFATIKYSENGVPLWTNRFNGPSNGEDSAYALAVDGHGNAFVTGMSSSDCVTIAYSSGGVPIWTNSYNGPGNSEDRPTALAVDGIGNVYVTGYSIGSGTNYDYLTIKYSTDFAPSLTISRTPTNTAVVAWPATAADFTLQQSTNATGTNWTTVGLTPTDNGTNRTVIVDPSVGDRFYRLMRP